MKVQNFYENLSTLHVGTMDNRCWYVPKQDGRAVSYTHLDRICEPVIELGLMAYHQNASAICDQCTLQFVLGIHIEVVGGLVEDEYIGGTVDQLAETHLCLFTAGQDFDKAFNMLGCKAAFCEGGTHLILAVARKLLPDLLDTCLLYTSRTSGKK